MTVAESDDRPVVGMTMGDPAGIGAEITMKAFADGSLHQCSRPLVVGDSRVLRHAGQFSRVSLRINAIRSPGEACFDPGVVDVIDLRNVDMSKLQHGVVSAAFGAASLAYLFHAIDLAVAGEISAIVTNPICKEAIAAAGSPDIGHTEILANRTHTRDYAMMLMSGAFRVAHVSTHTSLRKACDAVKKERVYTVIRLAEQALKQMGVTRPRIAVAGLNPHAGENGLLGDEEIFEIKPAVARAQSEGLDIEGPLPADTVFAKTRGDRYDVVIAMYHDQGHIPVKLTGFQWDEASQRWTSVDGVNVTLGLPIVRTSVDHGTAFDIAGRGVAIPNSLVSSVVAAAMLARAAVHERG